METGHFIDADDYAVNFYGYSKEELLNMDIGKINISASLDEQRKFRMRAAEKGHETVVFKHRLKNGAIKTIQSFITVIQSDGKPHLLVIVIDITKKIASEKALKESEALFKTATENLVTGIVLYREKYIYANPMAEKILGYPKEELYQKYVWDIYPDERDKLLVKQAITKRLDGEIFDAVYTLKILTKQNEEIWLLISASTVKYGDKYTALASFIDNTEQVLKERKVLEEKEEYKALSEYDPLTGIYNRRAYDNRLLEALSAAGRYKRQLSLIMFDIDYFKEINDAYGHQAGDTILFELASLVQKNIRKDDFFARFGGEEFMIISNSGVKGAAELAEKLRFKIETYDFPLKINVKCSFGVTSYKHGDTADTIIKRADDALYEAKENGRNRVKTV